MEEHILKVTASGFKFSNNSLDKALFVRPEALDGLPEFLQR